MEREFGIVELQEFEVSPRLTAGSSPGGPEFHEDRALEIRETSLRTVEVELEVGDGMAEQSVGLLVSGPWFSLWLSPGTGLVEDGRPIREVPLRTLVVPVGMGLPRRLEGPPGRVRPRTEPEHSVLEREIGLPQFCVEGPLDRLEDRSVDRDDRGPALVVCREWLQLFHDRIGVTRGIGGSPRDE